MTLLRLFMLFSALALSACTTAPYAAVGTTYKAAIGELESAGREPLGRLRTQVRVAYFEAYVYDIAHGNPGAPRPTLRTLLCQPQRPFSRALSTLALQMRAAKGIETIAQATPQELAPAVGTLGANYSLNLPALDAKDGPAKDAFDTCSDDAASQNPAGEFVDSTRIRESAGGAATGLTEVIAILKPSIISFISFVDQRRRASAIREYFAPCPEGEEDKPTCGNADKLIEAINAYGETLAVLNRYERRKYAVAAGRHLAAYETAPADGKDAAMNAFLERASSYDTALDSNILAYAKAVGEALARLKRIAQGEPGDEDLPAVIETFIVASEAFLAAAVAQESLSEDADTRRKLNDAFDKFLGREKKPKP